MCAQVAALGFVSVFDQIMEGLPTEEQKAVLDAFAGALNEDSAQYRRDAEELEAAAKDTKGVVWLITLTAWLNGICDVGHMQLRSTQYSQQLRRFLIVVGVACSMLLPMTAF